MCTSGWAGRRAAAESALQGSAGQAAWFQKEINGSEANETQGLVL